MNTEATQTEKSPEVDPRQLALLKLAAHVETAIDACREVEAAFVGEPLEESLKRCRLVLSRAVGHIWNRGRAQ